MAEEYEYQKQRKTFGRYPMFEDTDSKIVGSIPPTNKDSDYVLRDPNTLIIDNIPIMSEHKVSNWLQFWIKILKILLSTAHSFAVVYFYFNQKS